MTLRNALPLVVAAVLGAGAVLAWQHFTERSSPGSDLPASPAASAVTTGTARANKQRAAQPARGAALPPGGVRALVAQQLAESQGTAAVGEQKLRARYDSERTDPAWGPATEHVLRELTRDPLIAGVDAVPDRFDVDCRASTCRVDALFVSASQANDFFSMFTLVAATQLEKQSLKLAPAADGVHAEIYGMRPR